MAHDDAGLTVLLQRWQEGDPEAADRLVAATYEKLRRIAGGYLRNERAGHTLQPTALVHEAYLQMFHGAPVTIRDREEFFRLMAGQMRRRLVDSARRHRSLKRGAGDFKQPLDDAHAVAAPAEPLHADDGLAWLDETLRSLWTEYPRVAQVLQCRVVLDQTVEETAQTLGVATGTVKRDFAFGRALLKAKLEEEHG